VVARRLRTNVFLAASALRGHLGNVEEAVALPAIALVRSTTSSMLDAVSESLETRLPPVIPADMRAGLRLGMDEIDQVTEQVRRTRLDELRAGQTTMTATARRLRELAALDRLASRVLSWSRTWPTRRESSPALRPRRRPRPPERAAPGWAENARTI